MTDIDTRPDTVNLYGYAGDTLSFRIIVAGNLSKGQQWLAQIRQDRTQGQETAVFDVEEVSDGAVLTLTAEETARLAGTGALLVDQQVADANPQAYTDGARRMMRFSGQWDVQISNSGSDPVITLVQGSITLDLDVSRY